ncbi:MAG: hypothetical protein A2W35_12355 [Chloroflexi bacterium RBG_16_57_11]|nr:MAG: hypothetical protein A2W35_12355 [Chloroflexi bacterium RBG_16_57_11]
MHQFDILGKINQPMQQAIIASTPPPADYPFSTCPDEYTSVPFSSDFETRRRAFFSFILQNPAPTTPKAPWHELARLAGGASPHEGVLNAALDYIDNRYDGSDCTLHAYIRLLNQYRHHLRLSEELIARSEMTIRNFKYWPDEPGQDEMCSWTESHFILFASAGYLAGQLFPDEHFTNSGRSGAEMMESFRHRIQRWMDLRFYTGFSEWLSNVYYDEDLTALLSLVDFCKDENIQRRATMLTDLLLFEIAVNSFAGVFGCSHGRSYEAMHKWAAQESIIDTQKLLFGRGVFAGCDNMSAASFALSLRYRLPEVIYSIANDGQRAELLQRQRVGICIDQASWWGLEPDNLENGLQLLTLEAYLHPHTARLFVKMLNRFDWWENPYFMPYRQRRRLLQILSASRLLPMLAHHYRHDVCRNTREQANLYTYRTPDYMLSSAQDYRKGDGGDQQHIWQATLGPNAVCFTNHPARMAGPPPNYWTGSGSLPRVAQIKNVLIAIYHITRFPALFVSNELEYTHAWIPRDQFEEVIELEGWIFARLGEGFLGLLSQHPYRWHDLPGEDRGREVLAEGKDNIWICELGRRQVDGEFSQFIDRILQAEVQLSRLFVRYQSPSQGFLEFGWDGHFRQDGRDVPIENFPRYGSPYVQADFPSELITIQHDEKILELDWTVGRRTASGYVGI